MDHRSETQGTQQERKSPAGLAGPPRQPPTAGPPGSRSRNHPAAAAAAAAASHPARQHLLQPLLLLGLERSNEALEHLCRQGRLHLLEQARHLLRNLGLHKLVALGQHLQAGAGAGRGRRCLQRQASARSCRRMQAEADRFMRGRQQQAEAGRGRAGRGAEWNTVKCAVDSSSASRGSTVPLAGHPRIIVQHWCSIARRTLTQTSTILGRLALLSPRILHGQGKQAARGWPTTS